MESILNFFIENYKEAPTSFIVLEAIAFVFGILSVWYAKKENIWVYPTGLVATIISVYLLYKALYFGDMMMNFYYSIMSIYGWYNWARVKDDKKLVPISRTNRKDRIIGFAMFLVTLLITYAVYRYHNEELTTVSYLDILTSGIFFTAMWFMANKKIENWTLWIIANLITIPLYAYKGLGMLSLQYIIFTILAIQAYIAWKKSLDKSPSTL